MLQRVIRTILRYAQEHPLTDPRATYELEIRVGNLDTSTGKFTPGYTTDELPVVSNLLSAMDASVDRKDCDFELVSKSLYCIAYYDCGVRKSSNDNGTIVQKNPIVTVDFTTNRHKDIRLCLSLETTVCKTPGTNVVPSAVVMCQRHKYTSNSVIYDISKRTTKQVNKRDACLYPCVYHVELEAGRLDIDPGLFSQCAIALLGSYYKEKDAYMRLPPAILKVHGVKSKYSAFDVLKYVNLDTE